MRAEKDFERDAVTIAPGSSSRESCHTFREHASVFLKLLQMQDYIWALWT